MENSPLTSVTVPIVIPFSNTVTPGSGSLRESITFPFTITNFSSVVSAFRLITTISSFTSYVNPSLSKTLFNTVSQFSPFAVTETGFASLNSNELYRKFNPVFCFITSTNLSNFTSCKFNEIVSRTAFAPYPDKLPNVRTSVKLIT